MWPYLDSFLEFVYPQRATMLEREIRTYENKIIKNEGKDRMNRPGAEIFNLVLISVEQLEYVLIVSTNSNRKTIKIIFDFVCNEM